MEPAHNHYGPDAEACYDCLVARHREGAREEERKARACIEDIGPVKIKNRNTGPELLRIEKGNDPMKNILELAKRSLEAEGIADKAKAPKSTRAANTLRPKRKSKIVKLRINFDRIDLKEEHVLAPAKQSSRQGGVEEPKTRRSARLAKRKADQDESSESLPEKWQRLTDAGAGVTAPVCTESVAAGWQKARRRIKAGKTTKARQERGPEKNQRFEREPHLHERQPQDVKSKEKK
ncbi:hypothetical protein VTO42DRAFT_1256 [Malbranchea cinnamomea]